MVQCAPNCARADAMLSAKRMAGARGDGIGPAGSGMPDRGLPAACYFGLAVLLAKLGLIAPRSVAEEERL
jgi:hypothetical protein